MKKPLSVLIALLCVLTMSSIVAEVLEGPRGPVEFIGLNEWTASELFEAIKETEPYKTDPYKPFHACADVMKEILKFPDAATFRFFESQEDGSSTYTVVVGVENSTHIQYRTVGSESLDLPFTWERFVKIVEENFQTHSADAYVRFFKELFSPSSAKNFFTLSAFVEDIDGDIERSIAFRVLAEDKRWPVRFIAALVLAQYPEDDASWHALVASLIDPAPQVRGFALRLLKLSNRSEQAVPIRWSDARDTLVALLGGTNPFAFTAILNVLVETEIDPQFGKDLARERPHLLLAHVGAEHEKTRETALAFLKFISGEDFGQDVDAWEHWIGKDDPT